MTDASFPGVETERLWSVTTILKMGLGVGEPLVTWAANMTAAAAIDKKETLAALLREGSREEAIKWLARQRYDSGDDAKKRGTDVHAACEQIALGLEPTVVPGTEAYVENYLRWVEQWQPQFLMAEAPVYNLTYRYAGTCDGVMTIANRPVIFDIKTTDKPPDARSRPPYGEVALQLAAYANAELVGVLAEQRYEQGQRYYVYDPTAHHEPMPKVEGALCIVISPFDCFAVPVRLSDSLFAYFRNVQAAARYQSEISRNVFGTPLAATSPISPTRGETLVSSGPAL